jgi:hypothetical protein
MLTGPKVTGRFSGMSWSASLSLGCCPSLLYFASGKYMPIPKGGGGGGRQGERGRQRERERGRGRGRESEKGGA